MSKASSSKQAVRFVEEGAAFLELSRSRFDVIVIGAGQAGLSVGYHLARRGVRFVILDANERVGDSWRKRWDSLRLFSPARFDALDGMPFPAPPDYFPTKDEMADYLETYAKHFELPVRNGVRVERLRREDERYIVSTNEGELEAAHVVVAMANFQGRRVPEFASELAPEIVQLHSSEYQRPGQLREGGVLLVGAGNSGAEIALELSRTHRVSMSGRDVGQLPFRIGGFWGRLFLTRLILRVVFHRLVTLKTPIGRKMRTKMLSQGGPLIRVKADDLHAVGVERTARVKGTKDGLPLLEDGRVLDVANVIWCTGFDAQLSWIDLPIFGEDGEPRHEAGVAVGEPGLYFVGRMFVSAASSVMIHGVGRDASRIASVIAERKRADAPATKRRSGAPEGLRLVRSIE